MPPRPDTTTAPSFALIARQPLRPGVVLLAIIAALAAFVLLRAAVEHGHRISASRTEDARSRSSSQAGADQPDDPNEVDTIVLGGPAEAPVPGRRTAHPASSGDGAVHPFVIVHLPRSGEGVGQIPATPAGHLLYDWLAAFNKADPAALSAALPTVAPADSTAALLALRRQTGGFTLLSSREVQPGLLVFRLHDQTKAAAEALGTLQIQTGPGPAAVATFSLRAVPPPPPASAQPAPR